MDYRLNGEGNMKTPELLSPAGDLDRVHTALLYGADAVYLAGRLFGMRAKAVSFQDAELEQLLTSLREREDMRMLFKLAQDATPEDVRQAVKIIEALRKP